jgi:hypothetical protein
MGVEEAVHKAVHDILALPQTALYVLVGGRVFDRVPDPPPGYPYIAIGAIEVLDDSNTCSDASDVHVTLHVWSNAVGTIEAKRIGALVRAALAPADNLAFDGFTTSVSAFGASVYRPGADPLLTEGVLTFNYLVDPQ